MWSEPGIADLLKGGPRSSEDLAQATGTHEPSLYRALRLLTSVDLLAEGKTHSFLSRVIHDWDDERAIALLTRCKQAMQPRGKVLLVERLILAGTTPTLLVLESDVQMLVVAGGKEGSSAAAAKLMLNLHAAPASGCHLLSHCSHSWEHRDREARGVSRRSY